MLSFQKIAVYWQKIILFFKETKEELKKVQWPNRQETIKYTLIVIGFSVGVAFFLGAADYVLTFIVERII